MFKLLKSGLLGALALAAGLFVAQADTTNFTGVFAPPNWLLQPYAGTVYFSNSATWLVLSGPNAPLTQTNSFDGISYQGPLGGGLVEAGTVMFHWEFDARASTTAEADIAWTSGGGGLHTLASGGPGFATSGDYSIDLDAGSFFSLLLSTDTEPSKLAGIFTLSNFRFLSQPAPEPSIAALLGLGIAVRALYRNRRSRGC